MDAFAKGLLIANEIIKDKIIDNFIEERYRRYKKGIGLKIMNKEIDFIELENGFFKMMNH